MDIRQKFEALLKNTTEEEKRELEQLLDSLNTKKEKEYDYISSLLDLDGKTDEEGNLCIHMPIGRLSNNKLGITHGGLIATLADTAMGVLVKSNLPEGKFAVTTELKINYLSPGVGRELIAKPVIVKPGKQLYVTECKIYNDRNKLIAMISASFFVK